MKTSDQFKQLGALLRVGARLVDAEASPAHPDPIDDACNVLREASALYQKLSRPTLRRLAPTEAQIKANGVRWLKRRYSAMTPTQLDVYATWHAEEVRLMRRTDIPYGDTLEDVDQLAIDCRADIDALMKNGASFPSALKDALRSLSQPRKWKVQVANAYGWHDLKSTEGDEDKYTRELFDTLAAAQESATEYAADAREECRVVLSTESEDWTPYPGEPNT